MAKIRRRLTPPRGGSRVAADNSTGVMAMDFTKTNYALLYCTSLDSCETPNIKQDIKKQILVVNFSPGPTVVQQKSFWVWVGVCIHFTAVVGAQARALGTGEGPPRAGKE